MNYKKSRFEELKRRINKLDRVKLIDLPTPLHDAPNLTRALGGPLILFKREDLTGLAFGGNKSRMFEFVLGKVKKEGYDTVIAGASVQSNFCRQLVAACNKLNLDIHLVLRATRGKKDYEVQGNLLLDLLAGAKVDIFENITTLEQKEIAKELAVKLKKEGRRPYIARSMNENDLGIYSVGYVECMLELCQQLKGQIVNYLYVASGDTTHAGLLFGAEYIEAEVDILAFNYDKRSYTGQIPSEKVMEITENLIDILAVDFKLDTSRIYSITDYVGGGYGIVTKECVEAIKLVAKTEGIFLDPIYTGKAMAGLIDHIRKGKITNKDKVVFVHTGGNPVLFSYTDELDVSIDREYCIKT